MSRRAGIYARVSQDRGDERLGVTRQQEDCEALCERRGWTVVDRYIDNDISATSGRKRPRYEALLDDIESGRINAVVVWDLDRLHRRPIELERFITIADKHDVALASVGGDVDLAAPAGRLHARLLGNVAAHEMEHKSARQRRAAQQAAEMGKPGGGPRPFGYQKGGLTLEPAEAQVVREAYNDLLAGVPLREMVRQLNAVGSRTSMGKPWGATQLRAVLLRARNAGLREHHGEIMGQAQWPAIVSEDIWRAGRALLLNPSRKTSPGYVTRWLLSGLARCGTCGATVTSAGTAYRSVKGRSRVVYRCRTRKHVARNAVPVNELISQLIIARLSRPDAAQLLVDTDAPDFEALREEAAALRIQLDDAAAMFSDGDITAAQLRTITARLRARLEDVEARQAHASRSTVLEDVVRAEDVAHTWEQLSLGRQRAIIDTLMTVTIHPEEVRGERRFRPELIGVEWRLT